jgi:hypothetical protein
MNNKDFIQFAGMRPFNSPVETGLRLLFILDGIQERKVDIQRIIYLDYLLIHSADVSGGPPSLHAAVPHRAGEWLVKRRLIEEGLSMMISKELVTKSFEKTGVCYAATDLASPFLKYFTSPYSQQLKLRSTWLFERFGEMSDETLQAYMESHVGVWGAEFKNESLVRGLPKMTNE